MYNVKDALNRSQREVVRELITSEMARLRESLSHLTVTNQGFVQGELAHTELRLLRTLDGADAEGS